jgi:tRNA U34 5-methylaminomethyl-2-thiouridine-forming methyltransferase MnmC
LTRIVKTSDGSDTIYVPELDEHYHSVHGAIQESLHIFLGYGYNNIDSSPLNILEIGFGTGLNTFLTAIRAIVEHRHVIYTAYEKYPIEPDTAKRLNYGSIEDERYIELFNTIHSVHWNSHIEINEYFTLNKINDDVIKCSIGGSFDLIYFDAFGPDKQPDMWTREIFDKISAVTRCGGILVTYSAKGEVKRNLKACGFEINLLPGPPGKRQVIMAEKK